ncbi:hypothetical protein DM02DRAFT_679819 [Periconia macrospinosa]|uniref:Protein transport protein sec73 n=1 Tax=Periconia macrospinosa TaxID=97972 RepID=A0A2V1E6V9_9PLEO|nr:hypothetical protein DM02DRAFT_679819 [Periconia macrospinosa]
MPWMLWMLCWQLCCAVLCCAVPERILYLLTVHLNPSPLSLSPFPQPPTPPTLHPSSTTTRRCHVSRCIPHICVDALLVYASAMPLRPLRPNRSEKDLQRRNSTLDPSALFRRSDKSRNKSSDHLNPDHARLAQSQDGGRPPSSDLAPQTSWPATVDINDENRPPSPPVQEHTPMTRRFSLMRFRHASDSQLSLKAKEQAADAPPVPAVPPQAATTPAIITTAPTMPITVSADINEETPKRRGRLQQFSLRRRSFDPTSMDRPGILRKSMDKKSSSDLKRAPFGFIKGQPAFLDEPEQLPPSRPETVTESPHESPEPTSTLSLPVPRASDSSRSDGTHISFEHTPKPHLSPKEKPSKGSGRFGFGRKKQRASLFPLPVKIDPPAFPDTAPATPRASTSNISNISTNSFRHSPTAESPPLTAINNARLRDLENGSKTPEMPSPSQVALTAASMNLASPAAGSLIRNDSTKSIHSTRSSPHASAPVRLGLRGRSSTMGSLGGQSDDVPPPTPPYATSGRNSTSTAGRSSLSNMFGMSRFRQNSEPQSPRHGSPAHGYIGTPGLSSHQNSLNISREVLMMPEREEGETPGHYLERIEENNVDKSAIASYLTKTDDPFLLAVLRSYMRKFAFFGDPLDMATRKLLMQVELPKETQQIDRVLQGFADRYHECNPGIYINPDKAYFISFSIVILHTDFFNKNNKRKMQRVDYIKNSSCEGVSEDVLGCFYDNVVYTPFIHIEDEVDLKSLSSKRTKRTAVLKGPMSDPARKVSREPIDPYTLILEGKLDILRPNIKEVMNLDDPYSYLGTMPTLDTKNLWKSFSRYGIIQIVSSRSRPEAFMSQDAQDNPQETSVGIVEMPVTKVGILWRKNAKRKKTRSPWQGWGAILTRSGLSLFRNSSWAETLMKQHDHHQEHGDTSPVHFQPPLQDFKQDHMIPMDGAVALVDNTYKKHKHAFVVFSKVGEETFLADSEKDLNDWLAMINYSATFETLGVRPRGLQGNLYEGQRNRAIRRGDSSHSATTISSPTGDVTHRSGGIDKEYQQQMRTARRDLMQLRIVESEEKLTESIKQLENRLRDARHLQILAPVQPKTRELVIHAAGRLSAKLKWARIEIWRMKCHRDIMAQVLEDEKQGSVERTALTSHPQPSPQQLSKASKINGLARLSTKASSLSNVIKPPLSPATSSARPGTKSSQNTEVEEDAFKTPPETSRQSSPNFPSGQFGLEPLSLSPHPSTHRGSTTEPSTHSPKIAAHEHRPSVSTTDETAISSDGDSDIGVQFTTPPPIAADKADPKTPEISPIDGLRLDPDSESDAERPPAASTGSPDSRAKFRRSLQRTLRESHSSLSHRRGSRGHKTRDSASTVVSDDTLESEGLTRKNGSFTVHGKKASVIQFGPDWHNTPAEERLKIRKQAQEATIDSSSADERDESIASEGTAVPFASSPMAKHPEETGSLLPPFETRRQRHVSSQTITPASYQQSLNGLENTSGSDVASEMSEIAEESSKEPPLTKELHSNESGSEPGGPSALKAQDAIQT